MFGEHPYVKWAIKVIENYIKNGIKINIDNNLPEELFIRKAGCFVTLHNSDGSLRGCIGTIEPVYENLAKEIRENAISAATTDPRFPAVSINELEDIQVTVDILSQLEYVEDTEELDPSYYGIVVESGWRRGVLLPDLEGIDSIEKQIKVAKMKAGIYGNEPLDIYKFSVERLY
ncbi:hypothetical protein OSSY52_21810 [Tepiditoga spiralis]|uniref:AMMECR1 domain-containing protein n=1 Tax=Tepiditoga spiralis TaxID=2108365 RepID=A0A7G1G600_9BACT|nr:AmmeMemoRadiSam system protein A [Tepiditoga spiralis]BBE32040.1 hypothetical protein OSSY52_21810 [Tepiditoga spiralis]